MVSQSLNNSFASPLKGISKLLGNSVDKFLTRKLNGLRKDFDKIQASLSQHLEEINDYKKYNVKDIQEFENLIHSYNEIHQLLKFLSSLLDQAKTELSTDDKFYSDAVLLGNQTLELNATLNKILLKLSAIHDTILVKQGELSSSETLHDLWKNEEELWDNFYKESQEQ